MNYPVTQLAPFGAVALAQRFSLGYGGYPNPDEPLPHGPWDPWVRLAIERALGRLRLSPQPDPWMPQPQPWRTSFTIGFAQVVAERILDMHQLGEALQGDSRQAMVRHAGGFLGALEDEYCGTPPRPLPYPFPGHFTFSPQELIVIASQFAAAARFGGEAGGMLAAAADRFAQAGLRGAR